MRVREDEYKVFKYATTPDEVLHYIEEYEKMYARYTQMTPEECEGDECELFLLPHEHKRAEGGANQDGAAAQHDPQKEILKKLENNFGNTKP
jgi:hypothetical protein